MNFRHMIIFCIIHLVHLTLGAYDRISLVGNNSLYLLTKIILSESKSKLPLAEVRMWAV